VHSWNGKFRRAADLWTPITAGGYSLMFTDEPTDWFKSAEKHNKATDLTYSGGFSVGIDGKVQSVLWDGPAFNAGMTVGSELIAVNGRTFDADALKWAIRNAKGNAGPVELLIKSGNLYRTAKLDWHGGLRYPRLQKVGKGPGTLDALLAPR
jgi:predicted metalloprotease with PDZ domain